jgi:glycosyltransferase involved in cell wall biosynthesis
MEEKTRLSLIVPAYNSEKVLAKGLLSFLSQETSFPYEILLVIDPSKDETAAIAHEIAQSHPNLRLIETTSRLGPARCRYEGVLAARSPYLAFADCDDVILPGAFEDYVNRIEKENVDVVVYNYFLERNGKRRRFPFVHQGKIGRNEAMKRLFHDISLRAFYWNKVFRKEALLKKPLLVPVTPSALFEDTSFMASVFSHVRKVALTKKAFYVYVEETTSATQRPRNDRLAYHLACYAAIQRLFVIEKEDALSSLLAQAGPYLRLAFLYDAHHDAKNGGLSMAKARKKIKEALNEYRKKDPSLEEPNPSDLLR